MIMNLSTLMKKLKRNNKKRRFIMKRLFNNEDIYGYFF